MALESAQQERAAQRQSMKRLLSITTAAEQASRCCSGAERDYALLLLSTRD